MNNKNKSIIELGFQVIAKNYADLGGHIFASYFIPIWIINDWVYFLTD